MSIEPGLSAAEAETRLRRDGPNEIASERPPRWYVRLLWAFHTPFNYLLAVLAVVSVLTDDVRAAVVIGGMVLLSSLLRFVQEHRSGQAAEKLRAMVRTTATVARPELPGGRAEVPVREVVVGDVVLLSAGDLVPADVRVIRATDLFVTQAALTGESLPVEKAPSDADDRPPGPDNPAVCLLGSSVVSGSGRAVVTSTGPRTYLGTVAKHLVGRRAATAFDKGVSAASWLLIKFMLVMVPVIVLVNGFTKGDWVQAALFGVSVAVGLTPEMLPMIVTANLARGAVAMSRRKVIVKRLQAIQNFGAMDVLCTDKTGTLTQDRVALIKHIDVEGNESAEVLDLAVLNSYHQTGLKSLLDRAVLDAEPDDRERPWVAAHAKRDEIPFDFQRRRLSVVVADPDTGHDLLICKGAVEEVLGVCRTVRANGGEKPLDESVRAGVRDLVGDLNEDGLRVIAVATKSVPDHPTGHYTVADECDLTLVGFVAFLDPPKESAGPALAALAASGIRVKVLTGDNERVARKVCREVGLGDPVTLSGTQIDALSDAALATQAEGAVLFARLTPPQKARIVTALQKVGHTVGFLGDGINDAPALRQADVGISVDTAADVAREAADIILLEKSLLVLEGGVRLGRQTFVNTIKYLKMAASSNFGNVFSVLVASVWLPFLPMLAIQLLVQNLLYDISQGGIPFDAVDEDEVAKPRPWRVGDLGRFMATVGPVSSVFDLATFAVLWWGFGANGTDKQALFHSGWFVEGLLTQTLVIHVLRTGKLPFVQSTAGATLLWLSAVVAAVGVLLPYLPMGEAVGLVPLPPAYFLWLAGVVIGYAGLCQLVKRWYTRRFGAWL